MKAQFLAVSASILLAGTLAAEDLLSGDVFSQFRPNSSWTLVEAVEAVKGQPKLASTPASEGTGKILLNGVENVRGVPYLFTKEEFGDVAVHLEFMIPANSNAGMYFMGRYEIQILDSYGKSEVQFSDLGGIYQRWKEGKEVPPSERGYEGVAPKVNAAKAPGEWQTIDVIFQAPRFDASGQKTENAKFISVEVNGQLVQENISVNGPTRSNPLEGEAATGPIVIQGDHGPIAIRSLVVKPLQAPADQ